MRKLGIKVPDTYPRINSIKTYPRTIVNELIEFPSAIIDDSDYETDSKVLKNYQDDPVLYITKNSQQKSSKIENTG